MSKRKIYIVLFTVYIVLLVLIVLLKFNGSFNEIAILRQSIIENRKDGIENLNFVFFRTILPYIENITEPYAFKNILGNIITFIPMGFFISKIYFKKIFYKTLLTCIIILLSIECLQFIFMICFFDVDDIFLNLLGCLIGYLVNFCLDIIYNSRQK